MEDATSLRASLRWSRGLELVLVYVGLPGALLWVRSAGLRLPIIPLLLLVALGALVCLLRDPSFDRAALARGAALRLELPRILRTFGLGALALCAYTLCFERQLLFDFMRRAPFLYAAVVVLYPLLSAYPQELLYRAFFLHRYEQLFPGPRSALCASALLFGAMHLIFGNGLAVALTVVGGLLFGYTYLRTRSLLACTFEHGLYGLFVFTIGLGHYFYAGL